MIWFINWNYLLIILSQWIFLYFCISPVALLQGPLLQSLDWLLVRPSPQSEELHFLVLDFFPWPQVLVQLLHELQDPHCITINLINITSSYPFFYRGENLFTILTWTIVTRFTIAFFRLTGLTITAIWWITFPRPGLPSWPTGLSTAAPRPPGPPLYFTFPCNIPTVFGVQWKSFIFLKTSAIRTWDFHCTPEHELRDWR